MCACVSVCVCLLSFIVSKMLYPKVMNGFWWDFLERWTLPRDQLLDFGGDPYSIVVIFQDPLLLSSKSIIPTSASSAAVFRSRLKTHLFNISYLSPLWLYSACASVQWHLVALDTIIVLAYLLTYLWRPRQARDIPATRWGSPLRHRLPRVLSVTRNGEVQDFHICQFSDFFLFRRC